MSSIAAMRSSPAVDVGRAGVTTSSPAMRERVRTTSRVVRMQPAGEHRLAALGDADAPSAPPRRVPVEPSYIEALATSMPVSAATWVWNSNRYCSVPWAISGW